MSKIIDTPYPDGATIGLSLHVKQGRLFFNEVDLAALMTDTLPGQEAPLGSPLEVVYLPQITHQVPDAAFTGREHLGQRGTLSPHLFQSGAQGLYSVAELAELLLLSFQLFRARGSPCGDAGHAEQ